MAAGLRARTTPPLRPTSLGSSPSAATTFGGLTVPVTYAAAAGLCVWASLPPRGWWPMAPVGVALLALALRDRPWRTRTLLGAVAGVAWFAPSLVWAADFTVPGYLLLVGLQATFLAIASAAVPNGRWTVVSLPAALVLVEAARTRWPLDGFPLAGLSLGQAAGPFGDLSAIGGPLLIVAVVAALGTAASQLPGSTFPAVAVATLALGVTVVSWLATPSTAVGGSLDVTIVQGGGQRGIPSVRSDADALLSRHLDAASAIDRPVDLVVLPEGVVDTDVPIADSPRAERVAALARRLDAPVVAGVVEPAGPGRFSNAALLWDPDGRIAGRYDKVHRVPFGEYVPARDLVGRFVDLSLVPRDAVPGAEPGLLDTPSGPVGVVISYEVFFPRHARAAARAGARTIVVPTNAASFTAGGVPDEELAAARLRAIETGRWVLQAAPTGISGIVDPSGGVRAVSGLEEAEVLTATVDLRTGPTPYMRFGDAPVLTLAAAAGTAGIVADVRRTRTPSDRRKERRELT